MKILKNNYNELNLCIHYSYPKQKNKGLGMINNFRLWKIRWSNWRGSINIWEKIRRICWFNWKNVSGYCSKIRILYKIYKVN